MPTKQWHQDDYEGEIFRRVSSIIGQILKGNNRMGTINVLSQLPEYVPNPDRKMADRIKAKLDGQITDLTQALDLDHYNFEIEVVNRTKGAIINFRFSPKDVRLLKPKHPDDSSEEFE